MGVGGSVGVWVGGRAGSWLWVVDVFAALFSGPMVLSPLDDGALSTNWIHIYCCTQLLDCCSTWWVSGSLGGRVVGFVGGCVGWFVVNCVLS